MEFEHNFVYSLILVKPSCSKGQIITAKYLKAIYLKEYIFSFRDDMFVLDAIYFGRLKINLVNWNSPLTCLVDVIWKGVGFAGI